MTTRQVGGMAAALLLAVLLVACGEAGREPEAPDLAPLAPSLPAPGEEWRIADLDMAFGHVAAGTFQMGSNEGFVTQRPAHQVTLTRDCWLGRTQVTQAQWQAVMGENPSQFADDDRRPVDSVSWHDAMAFCQRLTAREMAAGRLPAGHFYRLPTEAEWEYAARGGSHSQGFTYSGGNDPGEVAWYRSNSEGQTRPVAQKQPNELGLFDMSGNVWEWCLDWAGDYSADAVVNPVGPAGGAERVGRGGSWCGTAQFCRVTFRGWLAPDTRSFLLGLRVALAPPPGG